MEAHQDSDNGGTDSQSVSSMEFGVVEGGARLEGGVPASKSLDSLDLRTGEGEEEGEDGSSELLCDCLPGLVWVDWWAVAWLVCWIFCVCVCVCVCVCLSSLSNLENTWSRLVVCLVQSTEEVKTERFIN